MVTEIDDQLPQGAVFFLVSQEQPPSVVLHVMEKMYIPVPVVMDYQDQEIGRTLYRQPGVGIPFSRYYVIDPDGVVTWVQIRYDPDNAMNAIQAALP